MKTQNFIEKCDIIHNGKYDYSLVNYKNNKTKIKIICKYHGVFEQRADHHLNGANCKYCVFERFKKEYLSNTNDFIIKSNLIHKYKYDYSLSNYVNAHEKISIICNIHGKFEQRPLDHLSGRGCFKCFRDRDKLSLDEFIERGNSVSYTHLTLPTNREV